MELVFNLCLAAALDAGPLIAAAMVKCLRSWHWPRFRGSTSVALVRFVDDTLRRIDERERTDRARSRSVRQNKAA